MDMRWFSPEAWHPLERKCPTKADTLGRSRRNLHLPPVPMHDTCRIWRRACVLLSAPPRSAPMKASGIVYLVLNGYPIPAGMAGHPARAHQRHAVDAERALMREETIHAF